VNATTNPPNRNPQAAQMVDESMLRTLRAQIECIWPQEREIFARYALPAGARVIDVGCGTGELVVRLGEMLPEARIDGVDLEESHVARARERCAALGSRVRFQRGDAFALDAADGTYDLTVCRHVAQAVPEVPRLIAELMRVTRPGGRLHFVPEDYGLMHFAPTRLDSDDFWRRGPVTYGEAVGCDLRIGRKMPALLAAAGLVDVRCDYVIVDTLRVPRRAFADIWRAWRDGYSDVVAENTELSADEVRAHFDDMIACIENPEGYGVWHVPVVSARKP
jgi:SAM-dependent methyltransferase